MQPENASQTNILFSIADGSIGGIEKDRGGNWHEGLRVWVHPDIKQYMAAMSPGERLLVERSFPLSLAIGQAHKAQIEDTETFSIWPQEFFEENGAQRLLHTARLNPDISDPFAILIGPSPYTPVPFSEAYHEQLEPALSLLDAMIVTDSPSTRALTPYLLALKRAYSLDDTRRSDLSHFHEADTALVQVDPETEIIIFAEPIEQYSDPLSGIVSHDDKVKGWVVDVSDKNGLGPWKVFFEFRLMQKAESGVTQEEVELIREATRARFASPNDAQVPASLEFRRLLLASGHGAHPAKTAKNYPNFIDIRTSPDGGYKNILYTNMIEEGLFTQLLPAFEHAFGANAFEGISRDRLLRGHTLRLVGHEENHPYRIHKGISALEELKATVDGFVTVDGTTIGSEELDGQVASILGGALFIHYRVTKARKEGDADIERREKAYHTGDTIMMNYLASKDVFVSLDGKYKGIDLDKFKSGMAELCDELEKVRTGAVEISDFQKRWGSESIWDQFDIVPPDVILN